MTPIFQLSPRQQQPNGFTLVEMLTVIAIISLLALLLIPRKPSGKHLDTIRNQTAMLQELQMLHQQAMFEGKSQSFPIEGSGLIFQPAIGVNDRTLVFWPDGSSNGGILRYPDREEELIIEWRTGRIYAK